MLLVRSLTYLGPGELEWRDEDEPKLEAAEQALVRPVVVANCDLDNALIHGQVPVPGPFPLGHEFIAEVVEVGEAVGGSAPGDRVVVAYNISCGRCERCRRGVTASCTTVDLRAMYGFPAGGVWGGALSDLVRVPFADAMLVPFPSSLDPEKVASLSDNLPDGWRTVGPHLERFPGADVLIVGGGAPSIGLYAAGMAVALGAGRVDYVDIDEGRLEIAGSLGANPIHGPPPERLGPYLITVDASARPEQLATALRSVEPGGVCTSVGIYFSPETPVPLLEMYDRGITFETSRASARPIIPRVVELLREGRFRPELVTTQVVPWNDAAEALQGEYTKLVVSRGG